MQIDVFVCKQNYNASGIPVNQLQRSACFLQVSYTTNRHFFKNKCQLSLLFFEKINIIKLIFNVKNELLNFVKELKWKSNQKLFATYLKLNYFVKLLLYKFCFSKNQELFMFLCQVHTIRVSFVSDFHSNGNTLRTKKGI